MRDLVAQHHLRVDDLVAPLFVREGIDEPQPIASLPGVVQHTRASLRAEVASLADLGVRAVILFGVPATKDPIGSGAYDPDGVVQSALRDLRDDVGDDVVVMADLCVDEYTDHGHCGIVRPDGSVDNDATLEIYARAALAQADAGAQVVAPSGMMDGQVAVIRDALDSAGFTDVAVMAYAAKFASALYGPFRDAVDVSIVAGGDRKGYQQDWRNAREAQLEIELDVAEGADIVMVKPALAVPRCDRRGVGPTRRAPGGVSRQRRVRDDPCGGRARLDRRRCRGPRTPDRHQTGRSRHRAHLLRTVVRRVGGERTDRIMIPAAATGIPPCDPSACALAGCTPTVCTGAGVPSNATLFERSRRAIPGGVNSSIRAFKAVGGEPYVVARASGATITDVEGNTYYDLVQSYGAVILGHAHPAITAAVTAAVVDGTSYGAPTPREMKLAEAIGARVPSCERVRLMNSGTEATSTAIRLARGVTGRDRIVTFAGNFHGATDALLVTGGSGVATLGLPGTAGVPDAAVAATIVAPYNVVPELDDRIAAVIVEPVAANMGVVAPAPGFLEGLRAECDRVGALLIFDEVITGFRLGSGGAQARFDVRPDITCFGKVIGGGLPIGAIGGSAAVMEHLSPIGPVFHAGTLSGNPIATAAGLAALDALTPDVYIELMARTRHLSALLRDACEAADFDAAFPVVGTLLGIVCGSDAGTVTNFDDAKRTDERAYAAFFSAMLAEGVAMAPGAYEALFVGLGHTDDVLAAIGEAAHRAAATARRELATVEA
jgi:glutamate-1-semialdehyde 2,1-aminomutase